MDSSGQNIFLRLVEQQASHTFDIHTDRTQELFWSSGETCCLPSLHRTLKVLCFSREGLIHVSKTSSQNSDSNKRVKINSFNVPFP